MIIFTPSPIDSITDGLLFSIDFFVCLFIYLFICFFISKITRKRLDPFAGNFQGRCGVTMGPRHNYIFGQFRETARCRDGNTGAGFVVLSHHKFFDNQYAYVSVWQ